jgi:hypothetical protein
LVYNEEAAHLLQAQTDTKTWAISNSGRQQGDIQHVPHRGRTNIRRRRTEFNPHGDAASGIFVPLVNVQ